MQALFDDHYRAYAFWREKNLRDLFLIHVDAHLDVSADGFTPQALAGLAAAKNKAEMDVFRGNPKLPWGGLHCGNFLYPALLDGTVTTLVWVIPQELVDLDSMLQSARQNLQSWVDMTFDEYRSFHIENGYVEGRLLGRRVVVCTCQNLPALDSSLNLALDIDVDYFIRLKDDVIWQTPQQLRGILGDLQPLSFTVATSCEGGYTPGHHRFLGQLCLEVFTKGPVDIWQDEVTAFIEAEALQARLKAGSIPDAVIKAKDVPPQDEAEVSLEEASEDDLRQSVFLCWQKLLDGAPRFMRPAILSAMGRQQEAEAEDPAYRVSLLDLAGRQFSKRDFAKGLAYLEKLKDDGADARYLRAFLAMGGSKLHLSLEQVEELLKQQGLTDKDRARLLALQADIASKQRDARKAVRLIESALELERDRASFYHFLSRQLRALGKRELALKALRKAIRLSKGRVSSLPMLLDASRLYDEMGQKAMAYAARRELEDSDVTGLYAINSILDVVNR